MPTNTISQPYVADMGGILAQYQNDKRQQAQDARYERQQGLREQQFAAQQQQAQQERDEKARQAKATEWLFSDDAPFDNKKAAQYVSMGGDPAGLKDYTDMSAGQRETADAFRNEAANALRAISLAPEAQRPMLYRQRREQLLANTNYEGLPGVQNIPPDYPGQEGMKAMVGSLVRGEQAKAFWAAEGKGDKPPKLETLYDDDGREYKARWDESQGKYIRQGGTKAPTKTAIEKKMRAAGWKPSEDRWQQAIEADIAGQQIEIVSDGQGGSTIRIGKGKGGADIGQKLTNTVEQKLFEAQEGLARIAAIEAGYRPEYQTFETKIGVAWTALKEKLGRNISPQARQLLQEFTTFKRDAIENINRYIKEITGAQMSEAEANRLRQGMPDPGEGLFDGNSPSQFEANMKGVTKQLRLAAARYRYVLQNGLTPPSKNSSGSITLDDMKAIINKRGEELSKGGMSREDVGRTLAIEFGLKGG